MSTDRETSRIVRSWLEDGVTALPDRVLDAVLDEVPATPQRRSWWPTRRIAQVNKFVPVAIAAAAVLVVAVIGYNMLPGPGGPGGQPTAVPTVQPTLAPLAAGSFKSHGAQIELEVAGEGANVTGSMTVVDEGGDQAGRFTVELACSGTTADGLMVIGGSVTASTNYDEYAPMGSHVAIVIKRGTPAQASFSFEHPDPPEASCVPFLEKIPDVGEPGYEPHDLEPIEGTVDLRP